MNEPITTASLMRLLQNYDTVFELQSSEDLFSLPTFSEELRLQMVKHGMAIADLMVTADISKTFIYQLLRGERRAGRDVVLRIAIVLKLTVDETQRLLTLSNNNVLYPRIRRDAAIIYALSRDMPLEETEELLTSLPEKSLYL